LYCIKTST